LNNRYWLLSADLNGLLLLFAPASFLMATVPNENAGEALVLVGVVGVAPKEPVPKLLEGVTKGDALLLMVAVVAPKRDGVAVAGLPKPPKPLAGGATGWDEVEDPNAAGTEESLPLALMLC